MKQVTYKLTGGLGIVVIGITILSLMGYLGKFNYLFDLASHFKFQYLTATLIALVWFNITRHKRWIVLALFCTGLNLWAIVPWYLPQMQSAMFSEQALSSQLLRVLTANVLVSNTNYAPLLQLIRQEQPDAVAIVETNSGWLDAMRSVEDILPYSLESPHAKSFGIALYSKFPLTLESVETFDTPKDFHLVAQINQANQQTVVVALHPPPPINATLFEQRNRELTEIAHYIQNIQNLNQPVLVMGDLNITMWSPHYQEFIDRTHLKNTRSGFGILPTWPIHFPVLSIPIDHVLVDPQTQVRSTRVGDNIGSDHLPLIADLTQP